jgi:hypothetical protein
MHASCYNVRKDDRPSGSRVPANSGRLATDRPSLACIWQPECRIRAQVGFVWVTVSGGTSTIAYVPDAMPMPALSNSSRMRRLI